MARRKTTAWQAGYAAAKQQAAEIAELYQNALLDQTRDAIHAPHPEPWSWGDRAVALRFAADEHDRIWWGFHTAMEAAENVARSVKAMHPSGTATPIERIIDGFRTRHDDAN